MWLDLIAFGALTWMTLAGLRRGTLATGLRLGSLLLAYGAAVVGATAFGPATADRLGVPDFFGMAAAALGSFVAAYLVAGIVARVLIRYERGRLDGQPRGRLDRLGGGLFGALQGAIVLLLCGWLGLWIEAAQASGTLTSLPRTRSPAAGTLTQVVVERGADALLDREDTAGRMAVKLVARPRETIQGIQELLKGPRLSVLQKDRLFWSYLEHGAVDAALNRASFIGLAHDAAFRRQLADVGLIDEAAADDARVFRDTARETLKELSPRIRGLREDPEIQALMRDQEVLALAESGDTVRLLAHPKFRRALHRVLDGPQSTETTPASRGR